MKINYEIEALKVLSSIKLEIDNKQLIGINLIYLVDEDQYLLKEKLPSKDSIRFDVEQFYTQEFLLSESIGRNLRVGASRLEHLFEWDKNGISFEENYENKSLSIAKR